SPRSGTTLLGAMLGAHPEVVCPPEVPFIGPLASMLRADRSSRAAEKVHHAIQSNYKFAFWKLKPTDLTACAEVRATNYQELIHAYVKCYARQNGRLN